MPVFNSEWQSIGGQHSVRQDDFGAGVDRNSSRCAIGGLGTGSQRPGAVLDRPVTVNPKELMESVIAVKALDNFHLQLEFNTGETRVFDARPYLEKGIFQRLKDPRLFQQAFVGFDTVCWPGNLDIAPETLYDKSSPVLRPSQKTRSQV